jgi:hypothetical protein
METERGVAGVRREYTPGMTEERLLSKITAQAAVRVPYPTPPLWRAWKNAHMSSAAARAAARSAGGGDISGHQAKLLAAVAAARAKAAARGDAQRRAAEAAERAGAAKVKAGQGPRTERSTLVNKVKYVDLQRALLLILRPATNRALLAKMPSAQVCAQGAGLWHAATAPQGGRRYAGAAASDAARAR